MSAATTTSFRAATFGNAYNRCASPRTGDDRPTAAPTIDETLPPRHELIAFGLWLREGWTSMRHRPCRCPQHAWNGCPANRGTALWKLLTGVVTGATRLPVVLSATVAVAARLRAPHRSAVTLRSPAARAGRCHRSRRDPNRSLSGWSASNMQQADGRWTAAAATSAGETDRRDRPRCPGSARGWRGRDPGARADEALRFTDALSLPGDFAIE